MSESFPDQYSRVRLMANGDPTWDLSPNDIAALTAVMDYLDEHTDLISAQTQLLKSFHELLDYAEGTATDNNGKPWAFIETAKALLFKAEGNT